MLDGERSRHAVEVGALHAQVGELLAKYEGGPSRDDVAPAAADEMPDASQPI